MSRNPFKQKSARTLGAQMSSDLVSVDDAPAQRRPYGTKDLVHGPEGLVYAPGGPYTQLTDPRLGVQITADLPAQSDFDADPTFGPIADFLPQDGQVTKKVKQWKTWRETTIPLLLEPYLRFLRETESLRLLPALRLKQEANPPPSCGCEPGKNKLKVSCIYFERIEIITICRCKPPALQLLSRGLFPCAPSLPSLAVDLNMLDFVRDLFVNAAPNTTAWCETLEAFLGARRYKLQTKDNLRRRFGNAMKWYATLVNRKNLLIRDYVETIRDSRKLADEDAAPYPASQETELQRPSEYLRARCPLCFGGLSYDPNEIVDASVCVDACFTHKRRKGKTDSVDPLHTHPETVFVPEADVSSMENTVNTARPPPKPRAKGKGTDRAPEDPDGYEGPMKVPISVLDECADSFLAADEKRQKASTKYFADTGLMALLCRHDRVLWLVNMTSAGERQFYALALLQQLFRHLPPWFRIGVLYDIACQLHRSCVKWGFLSDFLDRITFGISVFHAYGHQWPCQIIYHPRKCHGFGLTDGEGCERFWSAIKPLIPSMRVSGYHHRLYSIDSQVKHLDEKSLQGLGNWLNRKWLACQEKKRKAKLQLGNLAVDTNVLRAEWDAQINEQTKPLVRRSANLANKVIEEILALKANLDLAKMNIKSLEAMLETGHYDTDVTPVEINMKIAELETTCAHTQQTIAKKKKNLDIDGRYNLTKLLNDKFLQLRMNALALKKRIRTRLCQRKFELEGLERAYRHTRDDNKLQKHSEQQLKRKEPGIQKLTKKYNELCGELSTLIEKGSAPRGAVAPCIIEREGLFDLDVDDDIWQDVGLNEDGDNDSIPGWLGNDDVRTGIKSLLLLDRCEEEERCLYKERLAMQDWMIEEWEIVSEAINTCDNEDLSYQLQLQADKLTQLVVLWEPKTRLITVQPDLPQSWGPSLEKLAQIRHYNFHDSTETDGVDSDEEWKAMEESEDEDGDILEAIEIAALADEYRNEENWSDFF